MKLTKRERRLVEVAFNMSKDYADHAVVDDWLGEIVDDQGHTVEEYVAGRAPARDCPDCAKLQAKVDAMSGTTHWCPECVELKGVIERVREWANDPAMNWLDKPDPKELDAIIKGEDEGEVLAVFDAATWEDMDWPDGDALGEGKYLDFWPPDEAGAGSQPVTVTVRRRKA